MTDKKPDRERSAAKGKTLSVGIIGLGGYAGAHHRVMTRLEKRGASRLVCTCDPFPGNFEEQRREWRFGERRVRVYDHYLEMLNRHAEELDVVVIATPISLHAEMHREAVGRGVSVYLEKPPTLDVDELEEMIRVEEGAPFKTHVGFNLIAGSVRHRFKERLIAGEFGSILEVRLRAFRGRKDTYFRRAGWAGRLRLNGRLVLDSVMGNAASHDVQTALFFAGADRLHARCAVGEVTAELYRAHELESADTFFVKGRTADAVPFRMALTHACLPEARLAAPDRIELITEQARIVFDAGCAWRVEWKDGREESAGHPETRALDENHLAYYAYVKGETDVPTTTLQNCRSLVQLHALAYVSSGEITPVRRFDDVPDEKGFYRPIAGIEPAATRFLEEGLFPSEQHLDWARTGPSRAVTPVDLADLAAAIDHMAGSAPEPKARRS